VEERLKQSASPLGGRTADKQSASPLGGRTADKQSDSPPSGFWHLKWLEERLTVTRFRKPLIFKKN
jgi:hypothetical protein